MLFSPSPVTLSSSTLFHLLALLFLCPSCSSSPPPPLALFRYLPCTVFPVSCSSPPSFILLFLIISLSAESRIKRPGNSRNMVEEMSVVIGVAHEMASRLWWTSPLLLLHCRDLHIWHDMASAIPCSCSYGMHMIKDFEFLSFWHRRNLILVFFDRQRNVLWDTITCRICDYLQFSSDGKLAHIGVI